MAHGKLLRKRRLQFRLLKDVDFGTLNGVDAWFNKGSAHKTMPLAIGEFLVEEGLATKNMNVDLDKEGKPGVERVDISKRFNEKDFTNCQDEIRIRALCPIRWAWFDKNERFGGQEQLRSGKCKWIRKDIAEVAIKAGAAVLCPWPQTESRDGLLHQHELNAGFFIKTDKMELFGPKEINTALVNARPGVMVEVEADKRGYLATSHSGSVQ